MSEIKAWSEYSPAELLEALERNVSDAREVGMMFTWQGSVYRHESATEPVLICDAGLLRALVGQVRQWQVVAADALNALENLEEAAADLNAQGMGDATLEIRQAREVLRKYNHLQVEGTQ